MEVVKSRFFRPYAQWIISHRLLVAIVILGITAFLITRMGNLQMDSNPDLWAPQKHAYVETTNLLDKIFGGLPDAASPATPDEIRVSEGPVVRVIERDIPQSVIIFMAQGIKRDDPEFFPAFVMSHIVGGGDFGTRLTSASAAPQYARQRSRNPNTALRPIGAGRCCVRPISNLRS